MERSDLFNIAESLLAVIEAVEHKEKIVASLHIVMEEVGHKTELIVDSDSGANILNFLAAVLVGTIFGVGVKVVGEDRMLGLGRMVGAKEVDQSVGIGPLLLFGFGRLLGRWLRI